MSGEGVLPACPYWAAVAAMAEDLVLRDPAADERADTLAYLAQRRDGAAAMAKRSPEFEAEARERVRQIDVMIGEIAAGFHEGAADTTGEARS